MLQVCVFSYQALCLNKAVDIHQGFQALLSDINRSDTQYLLRTANRLFGEKTCDFLPVRSAHTFYLFIFIYYF